MYVTKNFRNSLGVNKADVPTGFYRRATFMQKFGDAMNLKAESAMSAIKTEIEALRDSTALPAKSRASVVKQSAGGKASYALGYIETEKSKEYLIMQVDATPGTIENPKGRITARMFNEGFSRKFLDTTLDNPAAIALVIGYKLQLFAAESKNYPRLEGMREVSMLFAEGML